MLSSTHFRSSSCVCRTNIKERTREKGETLPPVGLGRSVIHPQHCSCEEIQTEDDHVSASIYDTV